MIFQNGNCNHSACLILVILEKIRCFPTIYFVGYDWEWLYAIYIYLICTKASIISIGWLVCILKNQEFISIVLSRISNYFISKHVNKLASKYFVRRGITVIFSSLQYKVWSGQSLCGLQVRIALVC